MTTYVFAQKVLLAWVSRGYQPDRWVGGDAEAVVERTDARALTFEVEPGPGVGSKPFTLRVLDGAGAEIMAADVRGRQRIDAPLPAGESESAIFRLHANGGGLATPNDPRNFKFRAFRFDWAQD